MNEKSITTITLKKINKKSVYQYIYEHRQTAKQQIVQDLTMGLSTVSQNLNVLEKEGLISRDGFFESTGGRKAQVIQIVPEYRIAVGVGILKNMFHLAAVNLYGEAIAEETVAVPFAQSDAYYDGIASSLESFLDRNGYDREKILGVSIATQGIPAPDGESVLYGEILHNTDMKLADFSTRIPYPCRLEHDSKAAASLELWNHPEIESAVVFRECAGSGGTDAGQRVFPGAAGRKRCASYGNLGCVPVPPCLCNEDSKSAARRSGDCERLPCAVFQRRRLPDTA